MEKANSPDALIQRIQDDFRLGGHKTGAIAMTLKIADIFLVSEMEGNLVKNTFMHPYTTIQAALDDAFNRLGKNAEVLIMPYAGSTLPAIANMQT